MAKDSKHPRPLLPAAAKEAAKALNPEDPVDPVEKPEASEASEAAATESSEIPVVAQIPVVAELQVAVAASSSDPCCLAAEYCHRGRRHHLRLLHRPRPHHRLGSQE